MGNNKKTKTTTAYKNIKKATRFLTLVHTIPQCLYLHCGNLSQGGFTSSDQAVFIVSCSDHHKINCKHCTYSQNRSIQSARSIGVSMTRTQRLANRSGVLGPRSVYKTALFRGQQGSNLAPSQSYPRPCALAKYKQQPFGVLGVSGSNIITDATSQAPVAFQYDPAD
jgi:hypothetical protein